MDIRSLLNYVVILFPVSEIALSIVKKSDKNTLVKGDRGSLRLLWLTIIASIGIAITLQWYPVMVMELSQTAINVTALCFFIAGMIVRWTAIISLGKYFTVDVSIQNEHKVVQHGMYKYVRHPSYTGLLIEFLGLAFYFGTWMSVIILMIPISSVMMYRIRWEENLLRKSFGEQYEKYKSHTKMLIPGIL